MSENVFSYPGAKTNMADWIISHFPAHQTYVEVFAGSAAVLANKPQSEVEIINDRDGDIVHFFETLRDHGDELVAWLRDTPHSRELHRKYGRAYYGGYRPDDDVERAGRFWYLRESQFAAKYDSFSGYNGSKARNLGEQNARKRERLAEFSERFDHVQIENLDYAGLFERYDSSETLFYCDPPYVQEGDDLYTGDEFNHERFVDELAALDGDWVVSYTDLQDGLRDISECVVGQERRYTMRAGVDDWEKSNTERLVLSYDPSDVALFSGVKQSGLGSFE